MFSAPCEAFLLFLSVCKITLTVVFPLLISSAILLTLIPVNPSRLFGGFFDGSLGHSCRALKKSL